MRSRRVCFTLYDMWKWRDTDQIIAGELYTVEHGLSVRTVVFRVDIYLHPPFKAGRSPCGWFSIAQ